MQSHDKSLTRLPSELLTEIFRFATDNPVRDLETLVSWTPFERSYTSRHRKECSATLRIKHSLSLVSRLFRSLMAEFLYEDIWIKYGSDGLREILEESKARDADGGGLGYGRFVKRVQLSTVDVDRYRKMLRNTHDILSCCPYVRVLSRLPQENLEGQVEFIDGVPPLDDLDLPLLERVEWHNTPNDSISATAPTPSIFFFSHTLRVLILGPDNFPFRRNEDDDDGDDWPETVISLPNLHTLSIQSLDTFGEPPRRYSLHLPSLRRLVLERPEAIFTLFEGALSPNLCAQLTSLELTSDFRFLRQDFICTLLSYCPNISDLYIPVFATRAPRQNAVPLVLLEFPAVKRVYLNAALPNGYVYGQQAWWTMLESHFDGLCGWNSRFVCLERITLSGREWMETVGDERFNAALRLARMKGVDVVADDVDVQMRIGCGDAGSGLIRYSSMVQRLA